MSSSYPLQSTFNRGEISPLLGSRADVDFWRQSLEQCRNFGVLIHGGLRRRSGTRYIAELASSAAVGRLLPFIFSEDQAYVLALNDGKIRFIASRGVVESGGLPYEVAHPWAASDLARLSYAQVNDVAWVAHKNYATEKLTRSAETSWALADAVFNDGPWLDANTTATTLTPADHASLTPTMASLTSPSGTVDSTGDNADAWVVFDKNGATGVAFAGVTNGFISYQLASSATAVVDHYYVTATTTPSSIDEVPTSWVVEGSNDGSSWVALDTQTGQTGWSAGETRFYDFNNSTAYEYHRFSWKSVDGGGSTTIAEIGFNKAAESQTAFNLTASSTTGINDGGGFQATDVGRPVRLLGSDGEWRWAEIAARSSTTVVTIKLHGHALPDLSPIINWRLGAFSDESGWPGSVGLYNERLVAARTDTKPVTVYGSKQGDFEDFGVSDPQVETDGLNITLLSSNMNEILWLTDDIDLITGSSGQIRSIGPADTSRSFSATNLTQRKGPTAGASYLHPITVGGVVLYIGSGQTKIRELVLNDAGRYVAPELSLIGEHFFKATIADWAFSEKPDPVIYSVTGDGLLVAVTYDRDQKAVGFARHDVGGFIENVAVIPGPDMGYDDVYLIVRRTIDGATKRYIEVLERPFDGDTDTVEDAFFVDCGLTYEGVAATTITGLDHLEGEAVIALADGNPVDGLTVSGGQVTLPYAAEMAHVGLAFNSKAITLPIAGPGRDGTIFGRRVNIVGGSIDVLHSGSAKVGGKGTDTCEQLLARGDELFGNEVELRTGFVSCDIEGSWIEGHGQVVIETDSPLPLLVRSFAYQVENEP